jgi:Cu+-exporting ATPase
VPLEAVFDRQESGDCTSRVVFADLGVNAGLPAFARTTVRLDPTRAGSIGFAYGMNMVHGTLIVDPSGEQATPTPTPGRQAERSDGPAVPPAAAEVEAAQAAERRAEIADLTRRVAAGVVLTSPVLFPGGVGNTFGSKANFTSLINDVERKIFDQLPDDMWFYPGHDNDSTLGRERPAIPEWRARGW